MRLVKEVLPNGRVRFSRTFYAFLVAALVAAALTEVGLVVTLVWMIVDNFLR